MIEATMTARRMVLTLASGAIRGVSERKIGAIPTGSMTLKIVAKVAAKKESICLDKLRLTGSEQTRHNTFLQGAVPLLPVLGRSGACQRGLRSDKHTELPSASNSRVDEVSLEEDRVTRNNRHDDAGKLAALS